MRINSPRADAFYQAAFNDIESHNFENFLEKHTGLDFNKDIIYTPEYSQNTTSDESLINALISTLLSSSSDGIIAVQITSIIYKLMEDGRLDLTRRDINGRNPLNNFYSALLDDVDFYFNEHSIPDFLTISGYFDLYCAMLNYCMTQKYEWNLLSHPQHKLMVNDEYSQHNRVWSYFAASTTTPIKRELNQAELFENFLANYRLSDDFINGNDFANLSQPLQQKLKGQIYHINRGEDRIYKIESCLSQADIKAIKDLGQRTKNNKPVLPKINTTREVQTPPATLLDLVAFTEPQQIPTAPTAKPSTEGRIQSFTSKVKATLKEWSVIARQYAPTVVYAIAACFAIYITGSLLAHLGNRYAQGLTKTLNDTTSKGLSHVKDLSKASYWQDLVSKTTSKQHGK